MKNYQLICILPSKISEDELNLLKEKIILFLQEEGGIFIDSFKRIVQNVMFMVNFQINPEKLINLDKKIKSENQILKYMITLKKEKDNKIISSRQDTNKRNIQKEQKVKIEEIEKKLEEILK